MMVCPAALALIREREGLSLVATPDPQTKGDPWAIGYGDTRGVVPGMVITALEAEQRLQDRVKEFADAVSLVVSPKLNPNQFGAAVCFAYNVRNWQETPLFGFLAKGYTGLATQHWLLYEKADGVPMEGLLKRREAELALFQSPTAG